MFRCRAEVQNDEKALRLKTNFPCQFNVIPSVQMERKKYSAFPNSKSLASCARLVPPEGRLAIVTDAGRDAVDADALLTNGAEADGEVVWF
jgi:hypothetical protein